MPADLIIYAIVTAGLIFWLRSILGTRSGEERERPAPFLKSDDNAASNVVSLTGDKMENPETLIAELAQNPKSGLFIDNKNAENGLMAIAQVDRSFDVLKFLRAAQDAFVFVVESFAEGDRETLRDLLAPDVYAAFENAISVRETAGHTMKTEIVAIKKSGVTDVQMDGKKALVSIRFFAEEISVTRDANGEVVSGHPEKISQMRDLWTFSRDLKSRDPRWLLVATREDGEDDNLTIPNTD